MTCCLTRQYDSFWLGVRSGAQELEVIIFVCACIVYVSILIHRQYNTQNTRYKLKLLWSGEGAGPLRRADICSEGRNSFLWELTTVIITENESADPIPLSVYLTLSFRYLPYMFSKLAKIRV